MYTFPQPIYVTSPLLPPLPLIYKRLEDIWNAQWLTNMGKQHGQLESALQNHLGVPKLSLLSNGTRDGQKAAENGRSRRHESEDDGRRVPARERNRGAAPFRW